MSLVIADVLVRHDPVGHRAPVLLDSPHSGLHYPSDFDFICPLAALREAEDAHVDELFATAPDHGATLLAALFPRSYIDLNRAIDDIDPGMLDGRWPEPLRPSDKSALGMGLVRTVCKPGMPIYDGRLPVVQVMERIDRYYRPYHAQVAKLFDQMSAAFGAVWHIDCHSMPSIRFIRESSGGGWDDSTPEAPDFVLGDRDGTSCEPGFTAFMALTLRRQGYTVAINQPYKGVELVRRYSNPALGRHSLQLEINRRLYMVEETREKHDGFARLQTDLTDLVREVVGYAGERLARRAAE
ncbi:MAG TPA: N-formylglutamate amidohydrolase [Azospirillaceae bacterium]|nr:N-formylglutamate amidohydrolase [Azospirillaceae bacterium]